MTRTLQGISNLSPSSPSTPTTTAPAPRSVRSLRGIGSPSPIDQLISDPMSIGTVTLDLVGKATAKLKQREKELGASLTAQDRELLDKIRKQSESGADITDAEFAQMRQFRDEHPPVAKDRDPLAGDQPQLSRVGSNRITPPRLGVSTAPRDPNSFEAGLRATEANPARQDQEAIDDRHILPSIEAKQRGALDFHAPESKIAAAARVREARKALRLQRPDYQAELADPFQNKPGSPVTFTDTQGNLKNYSEATAAERHELFDRRTINTIGTRNGEKFGPEVIPLLTMQAEKMGDVLALEGKAGVSQTFGEKIKPELSVQLVSIDPELLPVIGGMVSVERLAMVRQALGRLDAGEGTVEDVLRLRAYLVHQQVEARSRTIPGMATKLAIEAVPFMVEMAMTGGSAGPRKAMMKELDDLVLKSILRASSPVFAGRVTANALKRNLPEFMGGENEPLALALGNAFGAQFVEVFTEGAVAPVTGELTSMAAQTFKQIPGAAKAQAIKQAIAARFAAKYPNANFAEFLRQAGWDGVVNEMLEERLAEVMNAAPIAPGVAEREPYKPPTWDQLLAEALSFSLIPIGQAAINRIVPGTGQAQPITESGPTPAGGNVGAMGTDELLGAVGAGQAADVPRGTMPQSGSSYFDNVGDIPQSAPAEAVSSPSKAPTTQPKAPASVGNQPTPAPAASAASQAPKPAPQPAASPTGQPGATLPRRDQLVARAEKLDNSPDLEELTAAFEKGDIDEDQFEAGIAEFEQIQGVTSEPAAPVAPEAQPSGRTVDPASLVKVRTSNGDVAYVQKADLAINRQRMRVYTKGGQRIDDVGSAMIHIGNIIGQDADTDEMEIPKTIKLLEAAGYRLPSRQPIETENLQNWTKAWDRGLRPYMVKDGQLVPAFSEKDGKRQILHPTPVWAKPPVKPAAPAPATDDTLEPWRKTKKQVAAEEEAVYEQQPAEYPKSQHGNLEVMSRYENARREWVKKYKLAVKANESHRDLVAKAISEGKPVPPEVLADYPDLTPKPKEPSDGVLDQSNTSGSVSEEGQDAETDEQEAGDSPAQDVEEEAGEESAEADAGAVEGAESDGVGDLSYEEFARLYRKLFKQMMSYTPDEVGGSMFAEQLAELSDKYPEFTDRVEAETDEEHAAKEQTKHRQLADRLLAVIDAGGFGDIPVDRAKKLFALAEQVYGASMAKGGYEAGQAYEALELAFNLWLKKNAAKFSPSVAMEDAMARMVEISTMLDTLPTQSHRTGDKDKLQQFSTPPHYAYVAAWVANIFEGETMLEPSAGNGGLLVHAANAGAKTVANDLDPLRRESLQELGADQVFAENAEHLNSILPKDIVPTVVIMNPPFSTTAGRLEKKDQMAAAKHIDQALRRLAPGGRLVAIVGKGMAFDAATFRQWWNKTMNEYNVRANVLVDGKVYRKYGTSFATRILVIDKTGRTTTKPVAGEALIASDLFSLLSKVQNDRTAPSQQSSAQPGVQAPSGQGGPARPGKPVLPATGGVVAGEGEAGSAQPPAVRPESESGKPAGDGPRQGDGVPDGTGKRPKPAKPAKADDAGSSDGGSGSNQDAAAPGGNRVEVKVRPREDRNRDSDTDEVFEAYRPEKVDIEGAVDHPTPLAQSAAMSSVQSPDPTYQISVPKTAIVNGVFSLPQLEPTVYAGQAHEQFNEDGTRRGFFVGDGTGVGKGRIIVSILWDNWMKGRKKAVWLSKTKNLFKAAADDMENAGWDRNLLINVPNLKAPQEITQKEGIAFLTYDTLKAESKPKDDEPAKTRIDQLTNWLGADFDGVIAFDEAHEMGNAISMKGKRGKTKPSEKALMGLELQRKLPKARIVYLSATGATEVQNLAYADRLGLWGAKTAFASVQAFVTQIKAGGVAVMELVARELKQMGLYVARQLAFRYKDKSGKVHAVEYDRLVHNLSGEQRQIYDKLAEAWQIVLKNVDAALHVTGGNANSKARNAAKAQFWGSNLRFFNQIITSMQMPVVIKEIEKDMAEGRSSVIQLVNTNAAVQERQLANMEPEEDIEELDMTPREGLMQYVQNSFPVAKYELYTDDNGNVRSRAVVDSYGNPVLDEEAVAMRDKLLDELGSIRVPDGPLEILLNHFGAGNVAEVTGRKVRVYRDKQGRAVKEKWSDARSSADAKSFKAGKKRILVFSQKGGTGESYHADPRNGNTQQRAHYVLQAGWRADVAIQGMGRTHRSNQVHAPIFHLVTTDLDGQRRFISSLARKLDQLGALTRGQRQAGSGGLFKAEDNLESEYAEDAVLALVTELYRATVDVEGISFSQFQEELGLDLIDDRTGALNMSKIPPVPQFLNRILSIKIEMQNKMFGMFFTRMQQKLDHGIATGEINTGLERVKAEKIEEVSSKAVHTDPRTGAQTLMVELKLSHKVHPVKFDNAKNHSAKLLGWYRSVNRKTGKEGNVYAVHDGGTTTDADGSIKDRVWVLGVLSTSSKPKDDVIDSRAFRKLDESEAKELWEQQVAKAPEFREQVMHMVTGLLLPIWDRLPGDTSPRVMRATLDDGRQYLGRVIPPAYVNETLKRLGADASINFTPAQAVAEILNKGNSIVLANNWRMARRMVQGENRIELTGPNYTHDNELSRDGVYKARIGYETRYFIPTGDTAAQVMANVIKTRPITDVITPRGTNADKPGQDTEDDDNAYYTGFGMGSLNGLLIKMQNAVGRMMQKKAPRPLPAGVSSSATDPKTEDRLATAHGLDQRTMWQKLAEAVREIGKWRRKFPELDTVDDAPTVDILRRLETIPDWSTVSAVNAIHSMVQDLSPAELELFERVLILRDLQKDVDAGTYTDHATGKIRELPFGYTDKTLAIDLAKLEAGAAKVKAVDDALKKRTALTRFIAKRLVDLEQLPESVLTEDRYYHRQVMKHFQEQKTHQAASSNRDVRMRRKGFQRHRVGGSDFNTKYIEAEFEYLQDAFEQIHAAETLQRIEELHNIKKQLHRQAKQINTMNMVNLMGQDWDKSFRRTIAIGMSGLAKLAQNGTLFNPRSNVPGFWPFLTELLQHPTQPGSMQAATVFKGIRDKEDHVKQSLGKLYATWESLVPDTHTIWQPQEGNLVFRATSTEDRLLAQLAAGIITQQDFMNRTNAIMALGGPKEQWVIPTQVAATLDNLDPLKADSLVERLASAPNRMWKKWTLLNPLRFLRYRFNNQTGDFDIAFAADPAIFKHVPRAAEDLRNFINGKASPAVRAALESATKLRVLSSGMTIEEIPDIANAEIIRLLDGKVNKGTMYWDMVTKWNNYFENLTRLAAFRRAQELISKGNTAFAWASNKKAVAKVRAEVKAGRADSDELAAKLASELIGDYGNISAAGRFIRKYLMPFYSWMEVNAPRYVNLFRNANANAGYSVMAGMLGKKVVGNAAVQSVRAAMLMAAVRAWNMLFFPDDDEKLHRNRLQQHLILGRTSDGAIVSLRFQGAFSDALDWFAVGNIDQDIMQIVNGEATVTEQLVTSAKAPFERVAGGLMPVVRNLLETAMGFSLAYPEMVDMERGFNVMPVNDRVKHLARMWSVDWLWDKVTGKPQAPGVDPVTGVPWWRIIFYRTDPGEASYYMIRAKAFDFAAANGKGGEPMRRSEKGQALYYYRQSVKWRDEKAAKRWLDEYSRLGGTRSSMKESEDKAHPLASLNRGLQREFVAEMSEREKRALKDAEDWYRKTYLGKVK